MQEMRQGVLYIMATTYNGGENYCSTDQPTASSFGYYTETHTSGSDDEFNKEVEPVKAKQDWKKKNKNKLPKWAREK